ncbi:MAG: DUF6046 domain-containing protein [Prevotella sp.]|jgi:hypothetical protein|nr:DUF6046 domain-containing protein [Prevotella sp.]
MGISLKGLAKATLLSGGVISHGSVSGYISDAARRSLGIGLAEFQDGAVHYFSKDTKILKRALIQTTHQLAYGALRSYPRFLKYWEQVERDKYLQTMSQTSIANKTGHYYQLIKEQKAVAEKKSYTDTIVGNIVHDYLELNINAEGNYFDSKTGKIETNSNFGLVTFVDLQPAVQVSSKNNIVLTTVQGRDYTRKEFISGGDLEIAITGKITGKYPDIYPEAEVSKFLKLMQYKGVIDCENTILRQFNITRLIILNYSFPPCDYRNIQPYSLNCVAVEPSEAIEIKIAREEEVDVAIKHTNKWIKLVKFGTEVVDPSSLLKISRLWL